MREPFIEAESSSRLGRSRAAQVARWFGLERSRPLRLLAPVGLELPGAGQILLISGASGAGKSTLLRKLAARLPRRRRIDLQRLRLPRGPLCGCLRGLELRPTLEALSRVGLAEAAVFVRPARQLSVGQQWRLRLALALHRAGAMAGGVCLLADEFAAVLDDLSAAVAARALRRAVSTQPRLCAIVASARDDLETALCPDVVVRCDFGQWTVHRGGR
jgi:ABC-type ATPase with predicted acetyltransferase domain